MDMIFKDEVVTLDLKHYNKLKKIEECFEKESIVITTNVFSDSYIFYTADDANKKVAEELDLVKRQLAGEEVKYSNVLTKYNELVNELKCLKKMNYFEFKKWKKEKLEYLLLKGEK